VSGKGILKAGVVIAVALALIVPSSTAFTIRDEVIEGAKRIPMKIRKAELIPKTVCTGNVLVSGTEYDDILPSISKDPEGNIVVAFTQQISLLESELGWGISTDGGSTFLSFTTQAGGNAQYNDIAWVNGPIYYGMFGVYIEVMEEFLLFYIAQDITSPETWMFYQWMGDAPDVSYACISDNSYLEGQYQDVDGPVNLYIFHEIYQEYDIPGCPVQFITSVTEAGEPEAGEVTFDGQGGPHGENPFATAPASDPDMSNEYMKTHHTWQYNDPEGPPKIVWKKIIPVEGDTDSTDIEYTPYQQYVGEGTNPAIAHFGNNVAIVYTSGGNVYCAYSSDDGETWSTSTIGPGQYPDICAIENKFQCAYISEGNLYVVASEDGGASWGAPTQVNEVSGTVSAEENAVDIHPAGIVWVDTRDGVKNIYYSRGVVEAPVINIKSVSGGFGISAVIENTGTGDATDVQWSISLEGGLIILGKETSGTIPILAAGESKTVKSGLIFGIGKTRITVTADRASKEVTGTVILFFVIIAEE
jgi:hypothetical protein